MPRTGNRNNFCLWQCFTQIVLSSSRHDRASAAQYVNDRRLDFPDISPKLGGHEAVSDRRIALPNNSAVGPAFRAVVNVRAQDFFTCSWTARFLLSEQFVFGCPSL